LQYKENPATVDVIGVILSVTPWSLVAMKNGENKDKRSITIGDDTLTSINVTLWGEMANIHSIVVGALFVFKAARINDYFGRSLNASSDENDIIFGENVYHIE
jgi:ssDNA-binding replication factor A large subunit